MDKTVDANESDQFMEDLELLQAVKDKSIPSFLLEGSPDTSE